MNELILIVSIVVRSLAEAAELDLKVKAKKIWSALVIKNKVS